MGKDGKRKAKSDLLKKVKDWIDSDSEQAKKEFKKSAAEIIEILKLIEAKVG